MEKKSTETPKEIPVRHNPDKTDPTRDPLAPSRNNPVNPNTDEPIKK